MIPDATLTTAKLMDLFDIKALYMARPHNPTIEIPSG